tara:strand:+ start:1407 stop:2216 length:810 start_codon:yes stop_codon:yes gene_type:complete
MKTKSSRKYTISPIIELDIRIKMKSSISYFILIIFIFSNSFTYAKDNGFPSFETETDRLLAIENSLLKAKRKNKLLILIIEAAWCQDSLTLEKFLIESKVKKIVESDYVILKIDAGWLLNLKKELSIVSYPIYYGTPSLLIVDPVNRMVLNRNSVRRWQSAHRENAILLSQYLKEISSDKDKRILKLKNQEISSDIIEFENEQADILYKAYAKLGQMLEKEKAGNQITNKKRFSNKVHKYRGRLQRDIGELYENGDLSKVPLPIYPPLM